MFLEKLIFDFELILKSMSEFIWGALFLPLMLLAAIVLSIGCRALQFRYFGRALKETIGKVFSKSPDRTKGISPLQAASTALGSTVGTGNIIGTAQAICLGGPGAVFWLWAAALVSMIIKYSELLLCIHYRRGRSGYGPMDYISRGLGSKKLAALYCFMALLSSFFMGNLTQASSISLAFTELSAQLIPTGPVNENSAKLACGLFLAGLTTLLLSGGAKRISRLSGKLVPFMVLLYIALSLIVVVLNLEKLPSVLKCIFLEAFRPGCITGTAYGLSFGACIQWGFRRSAFSNEAGLGTSAIAHASSEAENAAVHGLWGIFEVFTDTLLVCTCTALCILCSGIRIPYGSMEADSLYRQALESVFGAFFSKIMLLIFIGLFAYTSIMAWALYGSSCCHWLFGGKSAEIYKVLFVPCLIAGSLMPVAKVCLVSDLVNAIMALPNIIAVICLRREIIHLSRKTFP